MSDQYRKSPRANFIEYDEGNYFITVCTRDKLHYFGVIRHGHMHLSKIGAFLDEQIKKAKDYFPEVEIPLYVIMPNHVHLIIGVDKCRDMPLACQAQNVMPSDLRNPNPYERPHETCQRHVPTLSRYINSLKGAVTKFAKRNNIEFGWQSRFYDHLIRGTFDGNNIAEYIENNVACWDSDSLNN